MLNSLRLYTALQGRYLRPHLPLMVLLGFLLIGGTAFQLITPQIVRRFIDLAQEQGEPSSLYAAAVVFFGAALATQTLRALTMYLGRDVAWRATNRLRVDLSRHVLKLDMGFHNVHTPGDLLERIDGDIERLANFFSQFFIQLLGAIALLGGLVVVTWLEDWRFGLAVLGFAGFFLLTQTRIVKFTMPNWHAESVARADLYGFLGERLPAMRDIQKSGATSFTMRHFYEVMRTRLLAGLKAGTISQVAIGISMMISGMRIPAGIAVGAYLFQRGDISIGTVYLIWHYLMMLFVPVRAITHEFADLQRAGASIQRVKELLDTTPRVRGGEGKSLPSGQFSMRYPQKVCKQSGGVPSL